MDNITKMAAFLVFSFFLIGCTSSGQVQNQGEEANKSTVMASFYPLEFFTERIAMDKAEVRSLVPAGVEPHDYELSPNDVVELTKASFTVYNGAGMEHWITGFSASAQVKLVEASKGIELLGLSPGAEGYEEGNFQKDPHVWLNPKTAKAEAANILIALKETDPVNSVFYQSNAEKLYAELDSLDYEYKKGLADCRQDSVFTSHAAFAYLAREYGFKQVAISGLSPDAEPTPSELAEIVDLAKEKNIKYIGFESLVSPKLSQTIASEVGAQVIVLDPIEGISPENALKGDNYLTVMQQNLQSLRTMLECK